LTESVLRGSVGALDQLDGKFFADAFNECDLWRVWPDFRPKTVYLDIETDGGQSPDSITMVGLYDGDQFTCLVKGQDLDQYPEVIAQYQMVVTFYGSGFDLPVLRRAFPHAAVPRLHLDLCHTLKRLGFKGGLKKIEKQLGLDRGQELDGLTGWDAVRLWREYQRGRDESLERLIAYNREDVVNLEHLAQVAFDRSRGLLLAESGLAPGTF
jgi:uncharacterized protein YprB with RNaseH-like and TPR domain